MNSEKLLIIGCGDIGQRLAALLAPAGYQVIGLRRSPPPAPSPGLNYLPCDVTDRAALAENIAQGWDVIVVTMTPSERSDEGYRRAYVETCENLVSILREQPRAPRLLLWVSSSGVYGQQAGEWVDEETPPLPTSFSGRRLLEAEEVVRASDIPHCVVRFSGIYGPGRNRLLDQVRQGRAVLSGAYTNRIHADDCAGVLAHLIERQRRGESLAPVYLATDSHPAPMAEVVNWLAMQLKIDNARFAPHEVDSERGNKRCSNRLLLATGYQFRYPDYRAGYGALLSLF